MGGFSEVPSVVPRTPIGPIGLIGSDLFVLLSRIGPIRGRLYRCCRRKVTTSTQAQGIDDEYDCGVSATPARFH